MADYSPKYGMLLGYTTMVIALSAVFLLLKRNRDDDLGGVVRFGQRLIGVWR